MGTLNLETEQNLRTANKKLKLSSAIFELLHEIVSNLKYEDLTPDLQQNCLRFLSSLCFAQAEEVVLKKALKVREIMLFINRVVYC